MPTWPDASRPASDAPVVVYQDMPIWEEAFWVRGTPSVRHCWLWGRIDPAVLMHPSQKLQPPRPCKAKRQYLPTCKVSRYCLLDLAPQRTSLAETPLWQPPGVCQNKHCKSSHKLVSNRHFWSTAASGGTPINGSATLNYHVMRDKDELSGAVQAVPAHLFPSLHDWGALIIICDLCLPFVFTAGRTCSQS